MTAISFCDHPRRRRRRRRRLPKVMESSVILVKVDAVGFGVLHFSLVGFFGAGPDFTLMIGGIKGGAVFAGSVGLVIDALNFVAALADISV